ncbi:MAG TPA: flagellar motor protein MotB [Bacteroidetes bacterium]|nr:flagellar motor protein MotB [Bacteroidota bacterium]
MRYTLILTLMLIGIAGTADAQTRQHPKWWFGVSGAVNANFYSGTTQTLNKDVKAQAAFHDGFGIRPFASFLAEYRPGPVWGLMLNLGYDGRGGKFDEVLAPCNCPSDLKTNLSYITFEPSLRIAPFSNGFYIYVGGAASYALTSDFSFYQEKKPEATFSTTTGEFSDIRTFVFGGHAGLGVDIPLSRRNSSTQVNLSPFVSFHPYFGRAPRSIESWSLTTVRAGIAFKFGRVPETAAGVVKPPVVIIPPVKKGDVAFTVVSPPVVPAKRRVNETFPLRNYVFFEEGSTKIPKRYVLLNKSDAAAFNESQFENGEVKDPAKRSERQLTVYYNILNILGKRMQTNPSATVLLIGSSAGEGEEAGIAYANEIKKYLVDIYGISPTRITTQGRNLPIIPSEKPGGVKELELLKEGDRRVDIVTSPDLLLPLKVVAIDPDPVESRIAFDAVANEDLKVESWRLAIKDDNGVIQNYGPFDSEREYISGSTILGNRPSSNFDVEMTATMEDGSEVVKTSKLRLVREGAAVTEGLRYTILFDFDKPTTVLAYEKFLQEQVAPYVTANSTIIIHGHADIIGDVKHNQYLSESRANGVKAILENAVNKRGVQGVKYQVIGFGANENAAPFENGLPEERFYNRTVIIDIVHSK